ncbi:phage head morphogenesis protein, SPP1 gp7 family [Sphingobacterium spiritivorum]|uniref:Phage head morphogenesis protein, SPP1 gp7 family n=1 Tax=Sphingobacterium spiritivorum TaxID=258 RepID=A0A380CQ99_SPHSI|nr:phage minor head protein [Sphingobacterium spiritivorum]SUJ26437.1 phage head morphogenesis protein, SPP1 gp7 family [Sphingobacterium spiritivorum]
MTLLENYAGKITEALIKGFGKDVSDADWNTPNYEMLNALKTNVWQFSAAKTHTQLRDMSKALVKADGTGYRDFKDYKIEAQRICGKQLSWLRTEYDTAIGGGQMSALWVQIQAEKDIFPYIQFDAVVDGSTTDLCRSLDGVIKLVDDPYVKKYYPPNHYNCRLTVRRLTEGKVTDADKTPYPDIPKMFSTNLAENGLLFPADHAYYKDVPAHIINNATFYMPEKEQYLIRHKAADGSTLRVHRKTEMESKVDLKDLITISKKDIEQGVTIDILPEIHASEKKLRDKLLKGTKENMNPDRRITSAGKSEYNEVEKPTIPLSWDKIQGRIAKGAKQASHVTILLEDDFSKDALGKLATERFRNVKGLNKLTFVSMETGEIVEFINDHGQ